MKPLQSSILTKHACCFAFALGLFFGARATAIAANFTPGNLLVTQSAQLREYTPSGTLVQSIAIPHPESAPSFRREVSGVLVDGHGNVEVANIAATFHSYLSTFNPASATWQHTLHPGLGTSGLGNISDGDLSQFDGQIVMHGYQFNSTNFSSSALPSTIYPPNRGGSEISIGHDGLMYVVCSGSPREEVRVSDPANNFSFVRDLSLLDAQGTRRDIRGVAVTSDGIIFGADWNGVIYKYDSVGTLLGQLATGASNLVSLELDQNGNLVAGSRFGEVVETNTAFAAPFVFSTGSEMAYANFVTAVPEPAALTLFTFAIVVVVVGRCRFCKIRQF